MGNCVFDDFKRKDFLTLSLTALVAVIFTVPSATPVTKPVASTVAFVSSLLDQLTSWLASTGKTVAFNLSVLSTLTVVKSSTEVIRISVGSGATITFGVITSGTWAVTSALTVEVAMTKTLPSLTPVTSPLSVTVALVASLVDQVTLCGAPSGLTVTLK